MKELRLSEELLLLAINEKKGTIGWFKVLIVKYGLAGALLWELIDQGKLKLDGEKIKALNLDPIGDSILDEVLKILERTTKDKKVQHWIQKLSKKVFRTRLLEDLLNKGILRKIDEEEIRWSFSKERFRLWFDRPLRQTQRDFHDILIRGKQGDEKHLKLIGLAHACKLYGRVFDDREERRVAREKAKELSQEDKIRKGIRSAVNNRRYTIASSIVTIITGVLKIF